LIVLVEPLDVLTLHDGVILEGGRFDGFSHIDDWVPPRFVVIQSGILRGDSALRFLSRLIWVSCLVGSRLDRERPRCRTR
jgi:hypothetical protein